MAFYRFWQLEFLSASYYRVLISMQGEGSERTTTNDNVNKSKAIKALHNGKCL